MALYISAHQRRARLGVRHVLSARTVGRTPAEIAGCVLALHATDPASVYLSVGARSADLAPADVAAALYDDRTLIRMLGMRRTMFVVPTGTAPTVQYSASIAVAARLRAALVKDLGAVVAEPDGWLADVEDAVVRVLRDEGGATTVALTVAEPRLRTQLIYAEGKPYGGPAAISGRVLNLLSAQGRIVRGRSSGPWTGGRYEWAPIEQWLPGGFGVVPAEQARTALVAAWLARFGPATVADVVWWTGWNQGDTRRAVAALEIESVDLDGEPGIVLAADTEPLPEPEPWVALLPALDPTPMGWAARGWYLDPGHRAALFDRTGNIGPTVWSNGRVVGGWAHRADGGVVWRLLDDVGATAASAIADEAARLQAWIGDARVIPKFRTPLERELVSP
jgi:hypothetical protein